MSVDLTKLRNIGIAAHIDAGKTTTTERILYYTGRTHRMGEVDDGTTTTDFDEQEQKRGITIYSAAVTCPWRDYTINLIDTPGHVDFTAEVERSLRVLDGAVAVFDAKEGVEPQSETVWKQCDRYHVPRLCFINKMDKLGADFFRSFESIQRRLPHARPVALQIPIGAGPDFQGLIDLITLRAVYYEAAELGSRFREDDIPADLADDVAVWRQALLEAAAESSDSLMEKFLSDEQIDAADVRKAIRAGTLRGAIHPVLCGSSLKYVGVQRMLDAVCEFLPSPLDVPPVQADDAHRPGKQVELKTDPTGPLAALVFKIVAEKPVDLHFLRIYSGTLKAGTKILNATTGEKEAVTRLFRMFARRRDQLDVATAGDIVAAVGLRDTITGHTLCDARRPVILEAITFPDTVISVSIEPKSSKDRDKLMLALKALERQDPTVRVAANPETGQTLISGMGELHLEVLVERLGREMNVPVNVGQPRVSYRETVNAAGEGEGRFVRQTAGREHFAVVRVRVEPFAHTGDAATFAIHNRLSADALPTEFRTAIESGIKDAAQSGVLGGYPLVDWQATVLDAQMHETDSTEVAFENAARMAFDEAVRAAQPRLLEPIMDVEVVTPEDYFGAIVNDLNSRRAVIQDTAARGSDRLITADVPLREMFGYVTRLRTLSSGRATCSMTPARYAAVPEAEAKLLVG